MKKKSSIITMLLFLAAIGLMMVGGIGGARAALTYVSEYYTSQIQMYDIGVTLNENGEKVSWRDYTANSNGNWSESTGELLKNMLPEGEGLKIGKAYKEEISATNSGTIDEFVRVSVYRYWTDAEGNKLQNLAPEMIRLNLVNEGDWILDQECSTSERVVLYYNKVLAAGATTPALSDKLVIDDFIATKVTQEITKEGNYTTIKTIFDYNGVKCNLEAVVDAVQTHNAEDAIRSAWGRDVSIDGNSLSLR